MNNTTIKYISIVGINFEFNSEKKLKVNKTYRLKLETILSTGNINLELEIMILKIENSVYKAVYRNLFNPQIDALEQIVEQKPSKLFANITI
jgi:hypothetical protein